MIKWIREEAGVYHDKIGRFKIIKTWDRLYGNHWKLFDVEADIFKGVYHERTLLDCKLKAETIIKEKGDC